MKINSTKLKGKIDFGIITIREDEFDAVLKRFPHIATIEGRRLYSLSKLKNFNDTEYTIASVRCVEQGNGEGQSVARDLIEDLDPQWILLVGIAGGIPADEYTLGDVVAATRLHDFTVSANLDEGVEEFAETGGPMHPAIRELLAHLPAIASDLGDWNSDDSVGQSKPPVKISKSNFYGDDEWKKRVRKSLIRHFSEKKHLPNLVIGAIASSNRLVKDTEIVKQWRKTSRQLLVVEMELAGVYHAAKQKAKEYPLLAIRGISDIVGFKRHPDWTLYACNSAAAFANAILKTAPIEPRGFDLSSLITPSNSPPDTLEPMTETQSLENKKKSFQKYSKKGRKALIGLVLLSIVIAFGFSIWYYANKNLPAKTTVLIANFDGPDNDNSVTDIIFNQLEELEKTYPDIEILPLRHIITAQDGSKRAITEGIEKNATIVIWGFYQKADEKIFVNIQFELLKKPQHLSLRREKETFITETSEFKEFKIQVQLSKQMRYLTLLVIGLARYEGGDIDGAIARFTDALSLPTAPEQIIDPSIIYLYRGTSFVYKKSYDEAILDLNKAIVINGERYDAFNNRGLAFLYKTDYNNALADFNKALSLASSAAEAYQNRGLTYISLNRYDDAIADFNKALELQPASAPVYYHNRGMAFYEKQDFDNALLDYNKALDAYKAGAYSSEYISMIYHNLALVYVSQGDYIHASENYKLAIEESPDDPFHYISNGQFYDNLGEFDVAIINYDKAIKLAPNSCAAYNDRGVAYKGKGNLEQAVSDYNQAIKVDNKCADAYYNRGKARVSEGNLDGAVADFTQLISIEQRYDAYINRGLAYRMKQQYTEALKDYNEAIKLSPQTPDAYLNRGMVYVFLNQPDQAFDDFNRAIKVKNDYAGAYINRAGIYIKKGDLDNALSDFNKATEYGDEDIKMRASIGIKLVTTLKNAK